MRTLTNPHRRTGIILASGAAFALLVATAGSALAATAVGLGNADSFVVLAGTGVTNANTTTLSGDLGTSPDPSVTNDGIINFTSGENFAGGGPTADAKLDLETAFGAASQDVDVTVSADLGGQTLTPGVYFQATTMNLSAPVPLVLNAEGNPDAVWIFRAGADLIVGPGAEVSLINGAQACNVFWQVASSASLDSGADFIGTIMARTSITLASAATIEGRVLALDGTVTMIGNTITRPVCAATPGDTGGGETDVPVGTDTGGGQVTDVPTGSVATGDGSTGDGGMGLRSLDGFLLAAGAVAIGAGAATATARWHRRRHA